MENLCTCHVHQQHDVHRTSCEVAFMNLPVSVRFSGPTESSALLLKTLFQYAEGVKFAARLWVQTLTMTLGCAACNSFL